MTTYTGEQATHILAQILRGRGEFVRHNQSSSSTEVWFKVDEHNVFINLERSVIAPRISSITFQRRGDPNADLALYKQRDARDEFLLRHFRPEFLEKLGHAINLYLSAKLLGDLGCDVKTELTISPIQALAG